jgi:4-amino-4-deoxy-L-arabinose transferase-like glycosyltransferase
MYYTNALSTRDYLQFRVEPQVDYGYALLNPSPLTAGSSLMAVQFLGFAFVLSALLLAGRRRIMVLYGMLKGFISAGHRFVSTTATGENMMDQNSPQPTRLGAVFNKWRVAFLVFALSYAVILLLSLSRIPLEWDEVSHLNSALYLHSGQYTAFVNNAFYPPLFDTATALAFSAFGISLFSARLVSVLFSIFSLWTVFELANSMYNGKVALLSTVLLGVMPGFFWLSRMALLETMLLFFVTVALLFFYRWLQNKQDKYLVFAGLAVGLGFLTKYQAIVAGVVMLISILFLARGQLKQAYTRFTILVVAAVLVVVPWIVIAYQVYASRIFSQWLYALQVGNPEKSVYSDRYPSPIFYFIEVVWPYSNFHPISIFLYAAGLAGLVFLLWRHSKGDKFVLILFASIFIFFTFIENKQWRYVLPLFPALAIVAAVLIVFLYGKVGGGAWKRQLTANKKRNMKVFAGLLVALTAGAIAYSVYDAYSMASAFDIQIQLEPATLYALNHMENNQSIIVIAPFNLFSQDMIKFYLAKNGNTQIQTYQYPTLPVDAYTPTFNVTELISQCRQYNVKYLFTYELGGIVTYYNSTLNLQQIYEQLYASGNFSQISDEATFGANPRRIFLLTFTG